MSPPTPSCLSSIVFIIDKGDPAVAFGAGRAIKGSTGNLAPRPIFVQISEITELP